MLFKSSGAVEELSRLHECLTEKHEGMMEEDSDEIDSNNPELYVFPMGAELKKKIRQVQRETMKAVIRAFKRAKP